jgi:hypothetical protein
MLVAFLESVGMTPRGNQKNSEWIISALVDDTRCYNDYLCHGIYRIAFGPRSDHMYPHGQTIQAENSGSVYIVEELPKISK